MRKKTISQPFPTVTLKLSLFSFSFSYNIKRHNITTMQTSSCPTNSSHPPKSSVDLATHSLQFQDRERKTKKGLDCIALCISRRERKNKQKTKTTISCFFYDVAVSRYYSFSSLTLPFSYLGSGNNPLPSYLNGLCKLQESSDRRKQYAFSSWTLRSFEFFSKKKQWFR